MIIHSFIIYFLQVAYNTLKYFLNMIITKIEKSKPYEVFFEYYSKAISLEQKNIEALSVSSYNLMNKEVETRYVNLKYIEGDKFIFFTNYNSPKAVAFDSHNQVAALLFWQTINVQIRFKAKIKKMPYEFNQKHFLQRSINQLM